MSTRWICAFGICTILCARASACFCFSTPMCAQIGMLSESDAVFVGQVTDVWPARETIARETIARESQHVPVGKLRQLILARWHGTLTAEEERYVRTTTETGALEFRFGDMQRVRFIVSERLAGPQIHEVYTDISSCGYRFEPGLSYLVNANHDEARYRIHACSRTSKVESDDAVQDLKALRAWRAGNPLPPRIYGRIDVRDLRPETRLRLIDDQGREERVARLDPNGRFSLDGLTKRKHQLQVEDSRGKGGQLIDLSRLRCFEATAFFSEAWDIVGSPVELESEQIPTIPEPPPHVDPKR